MNDFNYERLNPQTYWQSGNANTRLSSPSQSQVQLNGLPAGDKIVLNGLPPANQQYGEFQNVFQNNYNVDQIIAHINTNPDINARSFQLKELFIELLDNDDFNGAIKAINATPTLIYQNAMFKGLIQELVVSGHVNKAVALTNSYPDARIKSEMVNYISNYLNFTGESTKAAQILGDDSFINMAMLKSQVLLGSVSKQMSNFGSFVTSFWSSPTTASRVAENAENLIGKQFRQASLGGGRLACAYTVSQAFIGVPGLQNVGSSECNQLAKEMTQYGFSKIAAGNNFQPIKGKVNYQPGDVVFFTRSGKQGFGHVGVISEIKDGVPYMVHNSSSKREVVKVRLDQYYKTPVAVYRKNG